MSDTANTEVRGAPEALEVGVVVPELTPGGIAWCAQNIESNTARVAVLGEENGWPAAHRRLARMIANNNGRELFGARS